MKRSILFISLFFCILNIGYTQSGVPDSSFGINGSVTTNFEPLPALNEYRAIAAQADGKLVAAGYVLNDSDSVFVLARYKADGKSDTTFGTGGKIIAPVNINATALLMQKDGKILVAGAVVARYNADGSVDSAFAGNGKLAGDFLSVSAMNLQKDGKILIAGPTGKPDSFILVRYNADGTPDSSFSGDGKLRSNGIQSILIEKDGRITTVGHTYHSDKGNIEFFITLARYAVNGAPDSTFGEGGILKTFHYEDEWNSVRSAVLQDDGKILLAGTQGLSISLARFEHDGSIDYGFGNGGQLRAFGPFALGTITPLVVQEDGKIIFGGSSFFGGGDPDFALMRYNTNGTVDNSFGKNGMRLTKVSYDADYVAGLAIINNRIYAAGGGDVYKNATGVIAGYTGNGEPDTSFGINGIVKANFESNRGSIVYTAAVLQADGKIIAAGNKNSSTAVDFAVARYNTDGSLDTTFSDDGKQTTSFGINQLSTVTSVAIQRDGKILVTGTLQSAESRIDENIGIVRYNADGSPDSTFNSNGKCTINFGDGFTRSGGTAIQSDGKIIVVGHTGRGTMYSYFAIARLNEDGTPDTTFDGDGRQTTDVSGKYAWAYAVVVQGDGKILVAGNSQAGSAGYFFTVARYNTDGSLDRSFNGNGIQNSLPGFMSSSSALSLQADGRIVIAGSSDVSKDFFVLARYTAGGAVDSAFGAGGRKVIFESSARGILVAVEENEKIFAAGFDDDNHRSLIARLNSNGSFDTNFPGKGKLYTSDSELMLDWPGAFAVAKNRYYIIHTTAKYSGIISAYKLEDAIEIAPSIKLTAPSDNAIYLSDDNIYLAAHASDADGSISSVSFYNDTALLYTARIMPYTFAWGKLPAGSYTLTAKATDDHGLTAISAPVHISVMPDTAQAIRITRPENEQIFLKGGTIHLEAALQDPRHSVTRVEFYNGKKLLATVRKPPYRFDWKKAAPGIYTVSAKAVYNPGGKVTSSAITISVVPNKPPEVAIITPLPGARFTEPVTINLEATAKDADGRIVKVDFYDETSFHFKLLASERKIPYTYQWQNVPAGIHQLIVVAQDNWGATTSAQMSVFVWPQATVKDNRPLALNSKPADNVRIRLVPNPVRDRLNLNITGALMNDVTTMAIISATGVTVKTMQLAKGGQTIHLDIASLASGVYTLKLISGGSITYQKFIKL